MSEEEIKIIGKKVDLLYRILLELKDSDGGHPCRQEYITKFMEELIPLFELSPIEVDIDLTSFQIEPIQELEIKLRTELSRLEKIYKSKEFLAKDEYKLMSKRKDITRYLRDWHTRGIDPEDSILTLKEWVISSYNDILKTSLFLDLKKKLGLSYESPVIKELIERMNDIKKEFKDLFKKLYDLGEANI